MKSTEKEEDEIVIRKVPSKEEANLRSKVKEIQGETSEPVIAKPSSRQKSSLYSEVDKKIWFYNFESIESLLGTTQIEEDRTKEETKEKRDRKTFATEKYEVGDCRKCSHCKYRGEYEDVRKERLFFSDIFLKIAKQKEVTKKDKEVIGDIMRMEGWIFCENRSCKLFTDLIKYLDQLYPHVYEDPVAMAITEACLFTLGMMRRYHILCRHKDFEETFIRYFYGEFSEEIKLAANIAHYHWGIRNTKKNTEDVSMFLLQIIKTFDSVNKQNKEDKYGGYYMGYEWSEITECFNHLQKDYAMKIRGSFDTADAKYLSNILRTICDIGRIEHHFYGHGVNELAKETIKLFMNTFKQKIMRKFKQKESFDSFERDVINCFCNSLNIVAQICLNKLSNEDINYICETIFICLNELEEFIKTNIYAVRIVEVVLYCLCNVVKCEIKEDNYLKKEDEMEENEGILWRFYRDCSTSESVKLAAAVSLVSLCQMNESQRGRNNLVEIQDYLKNIVDEMRERQTEEYRGFSLEEVAKVIRDSTGGTE